ncbi:hypothetical protein AVEN_222765-1 [Araneus ventricosus]|uniref:Uncharacterized protein n=1 Tax=Araneus ventricosus TaxID=182803 RepID=A0A4Y2AZR5_ARAVE|nr:hypothetical protein AVEN_222765-1 [Araneus ventricosus]
MVSVTTSEPEGREFYPGLCSCSVFAIICNEFDTANLLQVRFMVTSELSLTCCKLTASLHTCRDKFVANLHSCHDKFVASLLQTKIAIWVSFSPERSRILGRTRVRPKGTNSFLTRTLRSALDFLSPINEGKIENGVVLKFGTFVGGIVS